MTAADPLAPRVLIAESDPSVRDALRRMLLELCSDARLEVCADGSQALSALSSQPDLIIAARELIGLDGLDLLRKVRGASARPGLPFILMSERSDSASVKEALPLHPTAYLSKPLNLDNLRQRLGNLLNGAGDQASTAVPPLPAGARLPAYLEQRRATADGGPLFADVRAAVKRALDPHGLDLRKLEEQVHQDPQVTGMLIAAANSAAVHRQVPVQTLHQALDTLGSTQSMNLLLGLTLKRSARLSDPLLARHAAHYWQLSLRTADHGRTLARLLDVDPERCYCAGLLHRLGELAVLRTLEEWRLAGGALDEDQVQLSLNAFGAPFGSALRTRWRLPLDLRELIAAVYQLGGGVYSRDILAMNLAGQLSRLPAAQNNAAVASSKPARLLKLGMADLDRLRPPPAVPVEESEEQSAIVTAVAADTDLQAEADPVQPTDTSESSRP